MPWGLEIPLDPFFGIIATAPPPAWGRCGSPVPRSFGGNMDNKELRPGTTLYLPIYNEGALFFAGDGHGVQGDGEVCITALETGVTGTFRLTVRKDMELSWPFAESATHLMSIGLDEGGERISGRRHAHPRSGSSPAANDAGAGFRSPRSLKISMRRSASSSLAWQKRETLSLRHPVESEWSQAPYIRCLPQ